MKQQSIKPLVSVCILSYNQEDYIAQAIESIVTQNTNFAFELILAEDGSTDKTRAICELYASKYPHIIRLLPAEKNMGFMPNCIRAFSQCQAPFVSYLDGDDYWSDPDKLQKQLDYLNANEDVAMCFTAWQNFYEDSESFVAEVFVTEREFFTAKDFARGLYFHISTILFRRPENNDWIDKLSQHRFLQDFPLYIILLENGEKAAYLREYTSIYRRHSRSIYNPLSIEEKNKTREYELEILKKTCPEYLKDINYNLNMIDYVRLRFAYKANQVQESNQLIKRIIKRKAGKDGFRNKVKAVAHIGFLWAKRAAFW